MGVSFVKSGGRVNLLAWPSRATRKVQSVLRYTFQLHANKHFPGIKLGEKIGDEID